jgi:hypothetical protein
MHNDIYCDDFWADPKPQPETISEVELSEGRYRRYSPDDYRNKIINFVSKLFFIIKKNIHVNRNRFN